MTIQLFCKRLIRVLVIGILILGESALASTDITQTSSWTSIIPPLLAVVLAFLTKRIFLSLGLAIFLGSFLINSNKDTSELIPASIDSFLSILIDNATDPWNLKVIAFVLCILSMISLIIISGGLKAIVDKLSTWANSRQKSQFFTYIAGLAVFIDDYANTMIIGSSMRPVTDRYQVSREKLAFIIDATAAPVAGLAIISTWIGYEVGLFSDSAQALSIEKSGYAIFLDAFIFRFYCILMLLFVAMTIIRKREFGKMYFAELRAATQGRLMADDARPPSTKAYSVQAVATQGELLMRNALIPIGIMFLVLFAGLWIDGGGMQGSLWAFFNPARWLEVIQAAENSSTVLLYSALSGLLTAIFTSHVIAKASWKSIRSAFSSGLGTSFTPVGILLLAWSLKTVCNELNTGEYLVDTLSPHVSAIWFPMIIFIVAAITAFGTGTSWGTMAILIPIAFPLGYALDGNSYGLITILCMAAVLDGAIFGDHCSPISDTTIMSSIASHCDHIHHVQTQLPYSFLVACAAIIFGYVPAAIGAPAWLSLLLGIVALYLFLSYFAKPVEVEAKETASR